MLSPARIPAPDTTRFLTEDVRMSSPAISPIHPQRCPNRAPATVLVSAGGWRYELAKRGLDIAVSLVVLALLSPVLLAIALGVKLSSRGPVLFRQRRLGRGGRVFRCYKFRTMVQDAEAVLANCKDLLAQFDENYKLVNDPRITRLGAFLRKTSLDELPQFWNVLKGDMSLIGPRPIVEPELSRYGKDGGRLLEVKPGLGGIWQVSGRSDTSYAQRVAMDMAYIDSRSFWLDLRLLAATALVVIRGRGAY
jgi:lipopolysaccharide/colanic/teichoic acid biosynthesis glycosyltransferase